jgi:hypothetical protein
MVKILWFLKRKPGLTHQQFRDHYENSHVVMGHKYVGHLMTGYHRNYPFEAWISPSSKREEGTVPRVEPEWDCITEMRIRDEAAYEEILRIINDPVIGKMFVDDEHNFLDRSSVIMLKCNEVNTGTGTGPGSI